MTTDVTGGARTSGGAETFSFLLAPALLLTAALAIFFNAPFLQGGASTWHHPTIPTPLGTGAGGMPLHSLRGMPPSASGAYMGAASGPLSALSALAELTSLGRLAQLGTGAAYNYKYEDDPSAWGALNEVGSFFM